jgi:hypothetical protein
MKTKTPSSNVSPRFSLRLKPAFTACFALALTALASLAAVRANTIAENTGGLFLFFGPYYFGQSFTTVTVSPESNIAFNFFSDVPATTPYALGTGFLLSVEYLGTPSALSSSTAGFLGQATASGGFYTFDGSLTLQPATQYFFYENAPIPADAISGGNIYAGGHDYFTSSASSNFDARARGSTNFRVTGLPINGVPDSGSTWTLLLLGLTATFGLKSLVRRSA